MFSSASASAAAEDQQKLQQCSSSRSPPSSSSSASAAMAEVQQQQQQQQQQELERASAACGGLLSKLSKTTTTTTTTAAGDHHPSPHHHYHPYLSSAAAALDPQPRGAAGCTTTSAAAAAASSLLLNQNFGGPLSSLLRNTTSTAAALHLTVPSESPDPPDHHHGTHHRSSVLHQIASDEAAAGAAADHFVAQQQQQHPQQLFSLDHLYHGAMAASASAPSAARTPDHNFYDAFAAARSFYPHHHHHHHHPQFTTSSAALPAGVVLPSLHHLLSPYASQLQSGVAMAGEQGRALFTPGQLRELQQQALVLRYIKSGVNVPSELLNPIRLGAFSSPNFVGWGGYRLGFGLNADPEPGRCRRTDGKKWRCSRDVVPDQKYCERHIHRGRHRSRKPADSSAPPPPQQQQQQQMGSSPAVSSSSSSAASSITLSAAAPSSSSPCHAQQQHPQLSPNLAIRPYSSTNSPSASCLSVGSSITASQYNQMQQIHSSSKYIGGMRSDLDLGAEQMLFADTSGSTRAMSQDFHSMNQQGALSMLPSMGNSWRAASMQQSRAPSPNAPQQPVKANSPSIMQYSSPQLRMLLNNQDFSLMSADTDSGSLHSMAQQSQQHQYSFLGSGYGSVEGVNSVGGGREQESQQPLRHFFDDWPKSKDASTLCWSEVEEEKPNRNVSTTQLSISIPVSSSDFSTRSPPGKLKLSPLKLSMSRAGEDDIPLGVDLGVGMGLGGASEDRHHHHHHQAHWIPIAWETPVGGPLAEVLQSSTPRASNKNSGLNLMTEGWEESPRSSTQICSSPHGEREAEARGGELEVLKSTD